MSDTAQAPTEADWEGSLDLARSVLGDREWVALAEAALRAVSDDRDSDPRPTEQMDSAAA